MNWTKTLENLANITILILAVFLSVILAKNYFLSPTIPSMQVGEIVSVEKLSFNNTNKTVLVALQPGCPFCSASAGFYRQLKEKTASNNVHLVALFSEEVSDEKKYVDELNVNFDEVIKLSFDSLKIKSTPTIIVVNKDGTVESVWLGKLSPEKENQLLTKLF